MPKKKTVTTETNLNPNKRENTKNIFTCKSIVNFLLWWLGGACGHVFGSETALKESLIFLG